MSDLHVWKIETSESFWVVAKDKIDAVHVLYEAGMIDDWDSPEDFVAEEDAEFTCLDRRTTLSMLDDGDSETKTAEEWVASNGRGLLGSTVY